MLVQLNKIRTLLLGSWIGAAIFFSALVAPAAFRVLRSYNLPNAGELAGTIVNQTLSVVNITGFVISLLLLITVFAFSKHYSRRVFIIQNIVFAIMALSTGIGEWVIAAKMRTLRSALRLPIDQIDLRDPARVAFQALHGYSVAALSIAIIAALIGFFVIVRVPQRVHE